MRTSALAFASALSCLAAAQFQWEQLPDFLGTARDDAAAFSIDCDVYVGTGMQVGWSLTNDFWRYDSFSQTWSPSTTLPASPRQYCTAQSLFSQGYLFGGLDASGPLSELWSFDPGSQSWIQRASLPGAGRYACGSFVLANSLYICGGIIAGGTALNELWKYDPFTDSWEQRSSLPGVGRHRMATAEGGFVAGGADSSYAPLDECWQYNSFGDQWASLPALPEGRFGGSGASWLSGILFVAGAIDNATFRASAFHYTGAGWELSEAALPSERRGGVVAVSGCAGGWNFLNYGLGLDGTMARRNDWFGTSFAFSIGEQSPSSFSVIPNPATEAIRLPEGMSYNEAIIINAQGVVVGRISENRGLALPVHHLSAGAYLLRLRLNEGFSTARFIKLP